MLIGLIMIRDQVIQALEQRCACLSVILSFKQKLRFCEHLHQVDQAVATLSGQLLCVRGYIGDYSDD